jgi:hypothetical protein
VSLDGVGGCCGRAKAPEVDYGVGNGLGAISPLVGDVVDNPQVQGITVAQFDKY